MSTYTAAEVSELKARDLGKLWELQKRWLKMARMNKEINCFINEARLKACANELAAILKELEGK